MTDSFSGDIIAECDEELANPAASTPFDPTPSLNGTEICSNVVTAVRVLKFVRMLGLPIEKIQNLPKCSLILQNLKFLVVLRVGCCVTIGPFFSARNNGSSAPRRESQ